MVQMFDIELVFDEQPEAEFRPALFDALFHAAKEILGPPHEVLFIDIARNDGHQRDYAVEALTGELDDAMMLVAYPDRTRQPHGCISVEEVAGRACYTVSLPFDRGCTTTLAAIEVLVTEAFRVAVGYGSREGVIALAGEELDVLRLQASSLAAIAQSQLRGSGGLTHLVAHAAQLPDAPDFHRVDLGYGFAMLRRDGTAPPSGSATHTDNLR
jgi:hypothetical protein